MSKEKNLKNKRECQLELELELSKSAEKLKELESIQLAGDFSAEMARKINLIRYHMEVLENRISGNFDQSYRNESEVSLPKKQQI